MNAVDPEVGHGTVNGLVEVWTAFVLLGLLFSVVYASKNINRNSGRLCALLLLALAVMLAMWWFGLRRLPRFGLPLLAFLCVLSVPLIDFLLRWRPAPLKLLLVLSFATTAVLSTFEPTHQLLGRIRSNEWSRAAVFEIPTLLDELPEGTVVWNPNHHRTKNFALAGKRLANRVVYQSWPGAEAATDFIRAQRIDVIVELRPDCCEGLETIGAELLFEGTVGNLSWRVWSLPAQDPIAEN